jgi:pimeloyl-ACP methyl ester carboxylesterase
MDRDGVGAVEIDGGEIAYRRRGEGPPLVLLHGAVADSRDWEPQLDGGSSLVVIEGPGHVVNMEAPERFNEEVRSFLRG